MKKFNGVTTPSAPLTLQSVNNALRSPFHHAFSYQRTGFEMKFDTSVICNTVLILWLGSPFYSLLLQDIF